MYIVIVCILLIVLLIFLSSNGFILLSIISLVILLIILLVYIKKYKRKPTKKELPKKTLKEKDPKPESSPKYSIPKEEMDIITNELIYKGVITRKQIQRYKKVPGIYMITITFHNNGSKRKRAYIGESKDLIFRLCSHIYNIDNTPNNKKQYITKLLNKVDFSDIQWKVLESFDFHDNSDIKSKLLKKEKEYIKKYKQKYGNNYLVNKDEGGIEYNT